MGLILFIMAIFDIYTLKVSNVLQGAFLVCAIYKYGINIYHLLFALLLFVIYILYEQRYEIKIGGADVKIFCILLLGKLINVVYILFWSSLLAIVYALIRKEKIVPFVPFIWIGYVIVNI